jgi:hypothetical protein
MSSCSFERVAGCGWQRGRAGNPGPAKVGNGNAAVFSERRCSELALNPTSFTRRRGSGNGTSEASCSKATDRKKTPNRAELPVAKVSREP